MYYKGIDDPDNEPRRNKYASKKSKFTEEVAETVVDGDLYFSMRTPAHQRFYVPIEAGEHGTAEDADGNLICVTHIFKKPFDDLKGRWHAYDAGGNLVIKVRSSDENSLAYNALDAIESALYHTPLGRAIGQDGMRPLAKSLLKTFGIERDDVRSTFTVDPVAENQAQEALRELLTYAPEGGYVSEIGEIGAKADGVGFAATADEYSNLINGDSDGFGDKARGKQGEPLPFLSQPVFYAVLGYKGNGRGFQSRIDALCEAVGLDQDDLR